MGDLRELWLLVFGEAPCCWGGLCEPTCTEVVVSSCTCVPGMRCRDHLGLISYTEGVEDKVDKANLEQCNLRFKYQDANEACFSFPPPSDCSSLSRKLLP